MDRDEITAVTHGDLPFANPLPAVAIDEAVDALALPQGARVLDVGCGSGELLARIKARYGARTEGIETSPRAAAAARERVDVVHEAPFASVALQTYDLACCLAASHAIGTWEAALRALAHLAPRALVGEGYWRRQPSAGYLAVLGGASAAELPDREGLLAGAEAAGWRVERSSVASDADLAAYEEALIANGERRLAATPDPDLRGWVEAAKARWQHPDGRDTLGFALVTLRRG